MNDAQSMILPPKGHCFHCGEPVPTHANTLHVEFFGEPRAMCCMGCMLAAESIRDLGLESYYLDRSEINRKAALPTALTELSSYDHADVKSQFVYAQGRCSVADLSVVGLRCAACSWLIEKRLSDMAGVERATVNLTTQRMQVVWYDQNTHDQDTQDADTKSAASLKISDILHEINKLGYEARPYRKDTHNEHMRTQLKSMLLRLVVAGLGAMQAMMFAVAMYFGVYQDMSADVKQFLRWVSLVVSVPVFFYAGWPFFASAFSSLKTRQVNMDVPVSLALIITFFASAYAVLFHTGETYFDSVGMFVFFLLAGRYIEQRARLQAASLADDLVVIAPTLVTRKLANGEAERIGVHAIHIGDTLVVDEGDTIATDGVLLDSQATLSLALMTGESAPVKHAQGDKLVSGAQNYGAPFTMQVSALPQDSTLNLMDKLVNRSLMQKPKLAEQADAWASWFVLRVLVLASAVFVGWYLVEPNQAIWATVAVLVATCPCALSLATPIALTVATSRLAKRGFLITQSHVLETLIHISHAVFDKTGTLTQGALELIDTQIYAKQIPVEQMHANQIHANQMHAEQLPKEPKLSTQKAELLTIAASLELGSSHPVAKALLHTAQHMGLPLSPVVKPMDDDIEHAQGGVYGMVDGKRYRLGHAGFAGLNKTSPNAEQISDLDSTADAQSQMTVYLTKHTDGRHTCLAEFHFADTLRPQSSKVVSQLKAHQLHTTMLTGDPSPSALTLAQQLGFDAAEHGLTPQQKLTHLEALQKNNASVMMVGDGINDAPVLAKANLSVAMASAADLAQVSADAVVLKDDLSAIVEALDLAQKTQRIIQQNLRWAIGYNALVLLPAALGYVPPWLAALGMSLSSLVVVLNALRLAK